MTEILTHIPHLWAADLGNIGEAWWMDTEQRYETQRNDHLGIVAGISQEIGLVAEIDRIVGNDERKISCGQSVQALVLNALGFSSRALYLMPDYQDNKPVDLLIGPGLSAADFNDDTLGRCVANLRPG
jgi:hypothetical protein